MKYFYIFLSVIIIGYITYFVVADSPTGNKKGEITTQQMPDDDIHKSLKQPGEHSTRQLTGEVNRDIKERMESLKKKVDINPKDTASIVELAVLLAQSHKLDEAIGYFERVLKIDPKHLDVLFSLAELNFNIQNFPQAEKYLTTILELEPKNELAGYNLGVVYALKGEKDKAKKTWERIAKESSNSEFKKMAVESLNQLK